MNISKKSVRVMSLVCCATMLVFTIQVSALAQVTITQAQFYSIVTPGQIHHYYNSEGSVTTANIGAKGGPSTYDFSSLPVPTGISNNYFVSSLPPIAARFSGTAVTFGESPDSVERNPVLLFSNDTLYNLGEASLVPQYRFRHNLPAPAMMVFPLTVGLHHSYTYTEYDTLYNTNGSVDSSWSNANADSITVDGYGTLKIAGHDLQCLRIKIDHRAYGDKEFMYMTREGVFLDVMLPQGQTDTGTVQVENIMLLMAQTLSSVQPHAEAPANFSLGQNYPNPFNPTTTIEFSIGKMSAVNLKVFDVLGREVAALVNGQMTAGTHQVSFDASRLASGIYVYRLQTGSYTASRKLLLVK